MMVSSKFAGMIPPFKVPAICKKKLPEGPPAPPVDPLPGDMIIGEYSIHGMDGPNRWDLDGPINMPKYNGDDYTSGYPPGPDDDYMFMFWNPATLMWSGGLYIYRGGLLRVSFVVNPSLYVISNGFDTETFEWIRYIFEGEKTGSFHNPGM